MAGDLYRAEAIIKESVIGLQAFNDHHCFITTHFIVPFGSHKRDGKFSLIALTRPDKKATVTCTIILQQVLSISSAKVAMEPSEMI